MKDLLVLIVVSHGINLSKLVSHLAIVSMRHSSSPFSPEATEREKHLLYINTEGSQIAGIPVDKLQPFLLVSK